MAEAGTLADLVDRIDRYVATEQVLFEVAGAIARSGEADARTTLTMARLCTHHGWHVDLWRSRRPDVGAETTATARTSASPSSDVANWLSQEALPALVAEYEAHQRVVDPAVDAPTARVLSLVLADLRADLADLADLADVISPSR